MLTEEQEIKDKEYRKEVKEELYREYNSLTPMLLEKIWEHVSSEEYCTEFNSHYLRTEEISSQFSLLADFFGSETI